MLYSQCIELNITHEELAIREHIFNIGEYSFKMYPNGTELMVMYTGAENIVFKLQLKINGNVKSDEHDTFLPTKKRIKNVFTGMRSDQNVTISAKFLVVELIPLINCDFDKVTNELQIKPLTDKENKIISNKYSENHSDDLKNMLSLEQFHDFSLKCVDNDNSIKCNKCILAVKSKYFIGLFNSGMKESKENCLVIDKFSYETVTNAIQLVYGGDINSIDDCDELIDVALFCIEYQFLDTVDMCAAKLLAILDTNNFGKISYFFQSHHELEKFNTDVIDRIKLF